MESSEERVTHSIIFPFNNQWKCGPKILKSVENRKRNHLLQKINIIPCFQRWIRGHTSTQRFMADFGSLWRRFFFRLLTTLIPSSIRKYSYTFSKNFQPNIWMTTTSKHSWGSASVQYVLLQTGSNLGDAAQLLSIELRCKNTQMSGNKLVDTGCHLARGPENKKSRQFETADASSAKPTQHASLHFPSSKLLLLPGLNTVCSLFKATKADEWN